MQIITLGDFSRTAQNDQMDRYLCCCYVLQSSLRQASMLTRSAYIHSSINRRQPVVKLPSIRRVNAKNIAWRIAQKNTVQSLVPTCAFWLSAHMVANYMAWSLKIPDKLVDAYIHLALNQSARQGCSISVELHKKFGWFIFSTASFLVCNVEFWRAIGPR